MTDHLRVLVVTNMFPSIGRETEGVFVRREVDALRRARPEWDVRVLHIDTISQRLRYLTGMWRVRSVAREFRPHVVHVHHGLTQIMTLFWHGPAVTTFHGSDLAIPWQRWISRACLRSARPVVVSPKMTASLGSRGANAEVIGCGVDLDELTTGLDTAASHGTVGQRFVLGFPSSPSRPTKDFELFSQAVAELRSRGRDVGVVVFENLPPREVGARLRSLSCLVMTSRHEGSPVITREAMCLGTRVVSVDVGDVAEQVAGLSGCRVVESRDAAALADAVESACLQEPPDETAARMRFSVAAEADSVARVLEAVVDQG